MRKFLSWLINPVGNILESATGIPFTLESAYYGKTRSDREEEEVNSLLQFQRDQNNASLNEQLLGKIGDMSSSDLMAMALKNGEWAKDNSAILNTMLNDKLRTESYSKDMKAMMSAYKEQGLNPLLGLGNVGANILPQGELSEAQIDKTADLMNYRDKMYGLKAMSLMLMALRLFI